MATKSILKRVKINSNSAGARLAHALEKSAKNEQSLKNKYSKRIDIITDSATIRKMFND